MVPKKGTWVFICNFLGGNSHNYIKNHPIFENKSLFYAKILWSFKLNTYPILYYKKVSFGVWDLKTNFGLTGPKRFTTSIKSRTFSQIFKKQDLILSTIIAWNPVKIENMIYLHLGVWDLKPVTLSHESITLTVIYRNKASFYSKKLNQMSYYPFIT